MPTQIVSFGLRHGKPDIQPPDDWIDVRKVLPKNPYHDRKLRQLRGTDRSVQEELENTPGFRDAYVAILARARATEGVFWTACTGGHHRSVYVAILLGSDLGVPVHHLNLHDK